MNKRTSGPRRRDAAPRDKRASEKSAPQAPPTKVSIQEVSPDRTGQRLDNFLMLHLKGLPRSLVYRLVRTGQVRINGGRAKPDTRLKGGDQVRIPPVHLTPRDEVGTPSAAQLEAINAAIIHESREFLVLDKPAGMASHGGSGISFGAIELLRAARPQETLELAHRLDRDTSGVLIVARRRSALTGLQQQIREGRVKRRYLALLAGTLPQAHVVVDEPLLRSVLKGGERMVVVSEQGKPARSHIRTIDALRGATYADVRLESGRTHQIRVHCAHIGHAVGGDERYGDAEFNRRLRDAGVTRMCLHAAGFEFSLGENAHAFSAPLPEPLMAAIDACAAPPRSKGKSGR